MNDALHDAVYEALRRRKTLHREMRLDDLYNDKSKPWDDVLQNIFTRIWYNGISKAPK